VKPAVIAALTAASASRQPVAFAKRLTDGTEFLLPDAGAPEVLNHAAQEALAADRTGTVRIGGEVWFIEARNPAPRIIIIGAVHIAQALVQIAAVVGFATYVIDPRQAFATAERFPNTQFTHEWPDSALGSLCIDARTAIVTLTHDPKLDDPALDAAMKSEAFYIGALGSRKSQAARLDRLRAAGHDKGALARIHGPVGLDIGAIGAAEIALSIMVEILAICRGRAASRRDQSSGA